MRRVVDGDVTPEDVFGLGPEERRPADWLPCPADPHDHAHHHHDHDGIASVVLRAEAPIPGPGLALWLDSLLSLHGADVLRLKGIVRIDGVHAPVVLQAVHHMVHACQRCPLGPKRRGADRAARSW